MKSLISRHTFRAFSILATKVIPYYCCNFVADFRKRKQSKEKSEGKNNNDITQYIPPIWGTALCLKCRSPRSESHKKLKIQSTYPGSKQFYPLPCPQKVEITRRQKKSALRTIKTTKFVLENGASTVYSIQKANCVLFFLQQLLVLCATVHGDNARIFHTFSSAPSPHFT